MSTEYSSQTAVVGGSCVAPPNVCLFSLEAVKFNAVTPSQWLGGASTYDAQLWLPSAGAWTNYATGVVQGQAAVVDVAYEIGTLARWAAHVGSEIYYSGVVAAATFCCEGKLPPATPNAPNLSKTCVPPKVVVTAPPFSVIEDAETASIETRRRLKPNGAWVEGVHTFTGAGSWNDTSVIGPAEYEYSARACNDAGCSSWSAASSIALISSTLSLAWQSPAANASVKGKLTLRFAAIDSGGASNLQVFVNGVLLGSNPARQSGTAQNGVYTLTLDTRRAAQGAAVVEVRGTGSDGCKKSATLNLTFANTRATGVRYRDWLTPLADDLMQWTRLPLSIRLGELDDDPSRRYWGQAAITKDLTIPVVTDATDPEDAQEAFDAMQPFPFSRRREFPALGGNPSGTILNDSLSINSPGSCLKIRVRQEVAERFLAYDTGSETIPKIRRISVEKYLVFAQNPDKVFTFENDALALLANIETGEVLNGMTDVAMLADKVYFLDSGKLYARDTDGGAARTFSLALNSEARVPAFIETCGTKLIVLLVGSSDNKTLSVSIAGNQVSDSWTLAGAATLSWSDGADLYFACGADFYKSAGGVAAPTLVKSFNSNVVAIAVEKEVAAIGLADGSLQVLREGAWSVAVLPGGAAIRATALTYGVFEFLGATWGKTAVATLFGQSANGGYDVTRALGNYTGVAHQPSGIASLARYFVPDEDAGEGNASGTGGEISGDERTLVGTTGGVLLVHAIARQSSAGAWLHSSIADIVCGGVEKLIPIAEQ